MIADSIERLAGLGVWAPVVPAFLRQPKTLQRLTDWQKETQRSDDETVLLLLAAMRAIQLTIVDGQVERDQLERFLDDNEAAIHRLCQTRRVQANVAERALPLLELLGERWGRKKLFVTELGSSFGLIGRVLVSAPQTLENFGRYFTAAQQRPTAVPLVTGYVGIDLAPPDERWLLACIPLSDLRSRVARFIYEVPPPPECVVKPGSAFDREGWATPPPGTIPLILTSFMLYQLPTDKRAALVAMISDYTQTLGGSWINLDVLVEDGKTRFVVQQDGVNQIELQDDRCVAWSPCGR